jgi:hypothetical protein
MFVNGFEPFRAFGMAGAVIVQEADGVIKESGHDRVLNVDYNSRL